MTTDQIPSIITFTDQELTPEAVDALKARWAEAQKHGRIEVLPDPPPASYDEAMAILQTRLPDIPKASKAQYGTYANLADVSKKLLPVLGNLGLSFTARPTWVDRPDGARDFVLAYRLRHVSGGEESGEYPLGDKVASHQALGSAITYGRRYCLCALTGAVAEDDDDGQAASQPAKRSQREPPPIRPLDQLPRNRDGSLSRSKCTEAELAAYGAMDSQQQKTHNKLERDVLGTDSKGQSTPSTERLGGAPADLWEQPEGLRTPQPAIPKARLIHAHFRRLGFNDETPGDRDRRLGAMSTITGRKITSTNDLTAAEGIEVAKFIEGCRNRDALVERLAVKAGESMST